LSLRLGKRGAPLFLGREDVPLTVDFRWRSVNEIFSCERKEHLLDRMAMELAFDGEGELGEIR